MATKAREGRVVPLADWATPIQQATSTPREGTYRELGMDSYAASAGAIAQ